MNLFSLPLKPCKASTASSTDLLHMVQRTITLGSSYSSSSVHSHHPTAIFFIPWTHISQMINHFLIYKNCALLVQFRKKKKKKVGRGNGFITTFSWNKIWVLHFFLLTFCSVNDEKGKMEYQYTFVCRPKSYSSLLVSTYNLSQIVSHSITATKLEGVLAIQQHLAKAYE